jgi:hypothetical protein
MNKRAIRGCCGVAGVVMLCFVSSAFAGSVNVIVTARNSHHLDGYSVGPYTATVNGIANTQVICDDFSDKTTLNTSYTDTVNTFSSLGSTLWGSYLMSKAGGNHKLSYVTKLYEEAAWLTLQLLKPSNASSMGDIQFAIWGIFNQGALKKDPNAKSWLTLAQHQTYYNGEFSNFLILTPSCGAGPGKCQGQEFFELVPEGGTALRYLLLAGLACFAAMRVRSRQAGRVPPGLV